MPLAPEEIPRQPGYLCAIDAEFVIMSTVSAYFMISLSIRLKVKSEAMERIQLFDHQDIVWHELV